MDPDIAKVVKEGNVDQAVPSAASPVSQEETIAKGLQQGLDGYPLEARFLRPMAWDGNARFAKVYAPSKDIALTDGATVALDASMGHIFLLTATGSRTISPPTFPSSNQKIIIKHKASGGARTLTLSTSAGGFRFGTSIPSLAATASGKTDYIGAIYNLADNFWDVVAVATGY